MSYSPHTPEEIDAMLRSIGVSSLEDLFEPVPHSLRRQAELKLPAALGERSLLGYLRAHAERNLPVSRAESFLGAGAYHHYIPTAVDALVSRGEFLTAYTPYQAELSQGTLQAIFEFQTMICQLTGLEVANASLYDGASATAEAVLMAIRVSRGRRVLLSQGLHPRYRQVVRTYLRGLDVRLESLPLAADGRTQLPEPGSDTAAIVVQQPNFLGCVEDLTPLAEAARSMGALTISATTEALALALLRTPGESGVDIACGEAQSFGIPLAFGGPYLGFMATRQKLVRQLPGRLVGETLDTEQRRSFVMTLTTREQHIRRERATSNICTNQGLCMLRASIYLALLGRRGLRKLAEVNLGLAEYAKARFRKAGLRLPYSAPTFNEFVVEVPGLQARHESALAERVLPGIPLSSLEGGSEDRLLVSVTEMNRRESIDALARRLAA